MYRDTATALDERDRAIGAILISEALVDECDRAAQRIAHWDLTPDAERWRAVHELQDIYPEIWRNLDRARGELARRGANTIAYDELRPFAKRGATNGEGKALDVEAIDSVKRALSELKLAVSGVDWKAIAARTAGLVREPLGTRRVRHRAIIGVVAAAIAVMVAGWFLAQTGERAPTRAEQLRRDLVGIRQERRVRIAFLQAELGDRSASALPRECCAPWRSQGYRCLPQPAHELMRLLVLDGLHDEAMGLADAYTASCGSDPVIENWARAPRP